MCHWRLVCRKVSTSAKATAINHRHEGQWRPRARLGVEPRGIGRWRRPKRSRHDPGIEGVAAVDYVEHGPRPCDWATAQIEQDEDHFVGFHRLLAQVARDSMHAQARRRVASHDLRPHDLHVKRVVRTHLGTHHVRFEDAPMGVRDGPIERDTAGAGSNRLRGCADQDYRSEEPDHGAEATEPWGRAYVVDVRSGGDVALQAIDRLRATTWPSGRAVAGAGRVTVLRSPRPPPARGPWRAACLPPGQGPAWSQSRTRGSRSVASRRR